MSKSKFTIPSLREALSSPNPLSALIALVKLLYEKLYKVSTENSDLKVQLEEMAFEMRNLKKLPKKPDLKASKLDSPLSDISSDTTASKNEVASEEEESKGDNGATGECKGLPESKKPLINKQARKKGKRPGSKKRKKKKNLEIHAQERIRPLGIGSDWRKVAERPMIIQDIVFQARNTQYILEVWESPDKQEYGNRKKAD